MSGLPDMSRMDVIFAAGACLPTCNLPRLGTRNAR